jgi:hypothetical protein
MDVGVLANRLAEAPVVEIDGVWQRHAAARYKDSALDGWRSDGRWGTASGFPVLYLARPLDSVVVEAYRHLIDPVVLEDSGDELSHHIAPRVLITCRVKVTRVLDLRTATGRVSLDLPIDVLTSATNDEAAYRRCREVAAAAHQHGLHGLVTPAATGVEGGETLALFPVNLPAAERPSLTDTELWNDLPPDPRRAGGRLRLVRSGP